MSKSKPTIHDVAKAAGVSIATVSRAMNHIETVKPKTLQKVKEAIIEVGYLNEADLINVEHSNIILVLLPEISNLFYSKIIEGIHSAAKIGGYEELLRQIGSSDYPLERIEKLVRLTKAAGIIFLGPVSDPDTLSAISTTTPIVQCCEYNELSNQSYVSVDDYAATKNIINYMITKGYRKIALINGSIKYKYARQRQIGYLDALKEAGLQTNPNWMIQMPEISYEPVIPLVMQLLNSDNRPDAIFAVSDTYGVASIKAAKRCGLSIPDDIAIAGFDNTYLASISEPTLTTVSQPQFQLGYLAGEILMERISNPKIPCQQILLDTELIVRESC